MEAALDQELLDLLGAGGSQAPAQSPAKQPPQTKTASPESSDDEEEEGEEEDDRSETAIGYRRPTHGGKRPPTMISAPSTGKSKKSTIKAKSGNRKTAAKKRKAADTFDSDAESSEEEASDDESESSFLTSSDEEASRGEEGGSDGAQDSDQEELEQTQQELYRLEQQLAGESMQGLTEFEREQRMAELGEKKQRLLEKLEIKKRLMRTTGGKRFGGGAITSPVKRSQRDRKSSNQKALQRLKDKRRRKSSRRGGARDDDDFESDEDSDDDLLELESDDEDADGMNYRQRIRGTYDQKSSKALDDSGSLWITLKEVNELRVTRDHLEKWVYAPFFEDVVIGCFVRVGLGLGPDKQPVYRVAQIADVVDYHRTYKFNQLTTKKALKLKHGRAEKVFLMDIISNGDFTEGEFNRWMKQMKADKERIISKARFSDLKKRLDEARAHVFTDTDIAHMVKSKQSTYAVPKNLSVQKLQLMTKRDAAAASGDIVQVRRIESQLRQLDQFIENGDDSVNYASPGKTDKKDLWAKLNERNRRMNFEEGGKAEQMVRKERIDTLMGVQQKDKKEAPKRDPFARIKATPTIQIHHQNNNEDDSQLNTPVDEKPNSGQTSGNRASPITAEGVDAVVIVTPTDAYSQALQSVDLDIDI